MTTTRREFLRQSAIGGLSLVVVVQQAGCRRTPATPALAPNQWIEVGPDGTVTLVLDKSEMGQGVSTSLPMIMAEELGADWSRVRVVHARPGPRFTEMGTSGSGSVIQGWFTHRVAAAAARTMLVAAAAEAWRVPPAECHTEGGTVQHRPSGRRAPFQVFVAAARLHPVPAEPPLKPRDQYRLLGTRVADPALPAITTGSLTFAADLRMPGLRYAVIARSPVHGGRLRRMNAEPARAIPGVTLVVEQPSGVAVVATSSWAALRGREALELEWDEGPNAGFDNESAWQLLEAALQRGGKVARTDGDAAAALARAARRIEAEYRWPWQAHAALEPLCAVAFAQDHACEVWAGTQNPNDALDVVAEALRLPASRVSINVLRLGGGFGRRIANDFIREAVLVSRAARAPVQLLWSREDDFRHDMYNPAQVNRLAAGLDAAGRIAAWSHRVADFHLSMFGPFNPNSDPAADGDPWGGFDAPYAVPDLRVELAVAESPIPSGAWRSVSYPAAVLARECFLDEIAHLTGVDPLDLRLTLIPSPGNVTRGGVVVPNGDRLRAVLRLAAGRAGWGGPAPESARGRRFGRGIACNPYHRGTMVAQVAEVSVGEAGDILVHRLVSAVDGGQVINRAGVEKQFEGGVAWALSALFGPGVRFERGRTVTAGYADYPVLTMAGMPVLETHIVDSGVRPFGMGEPPVPAVAPAVLNAVFAATGVRLRSLPIVPGALRQA